MNIDIDAPLPLLTYRYAHESTQATIGYFSCLPPDDMDTEAALQRLEAAPMDDFLHLHLLRHLMEKDVANLRDVATSCYDVDRDVFTRPVMAAILAECALLAAGDTNDMAHALAQVGLPADAAHRLAAWSPTVHLRAYSLPNHAAAAAWSVFFRRNICEHRSLPAPDEVSIPPLFTKAEIDSQVEQLKKYSGSMARMYASMAKNPGPIVSRPLAQQTYLRALDALMENGFLDGQEMRHEASLSPIALLRDWQVNLCVENGALQHLLKGKATAYGRGLSLAAARASYAMEIVERASAYVSVQPGDGTAAHAGSISDRKHQLTLRRARRSELIAEGLVVLDPDCLPLDVPYNDAPLHWLPAVSTRGERVLVPAQAVFLFCNLDEPSLFQASGSTGLAAGNTMDEAMVAALTEIVERDAEATTPFVRSQCFVLQSRDARIQSLLDDYANCGIHVQFQDITTELGLPAYQCFVQGQDGNVARATAASLSGPQAALSALTETPWPYSTTQTTLPHPSGPGLSGLPVRMLEDLPDYSLPSAAANRRLLEGLFLAQGKEPLYIDITRSDLDIPVVRAIVPGLQLTPDLDRFSRPCLRLFARYAALFR